VGDIEIRARTNADAACLMRELVSHSPRQERRVIRIALDASAPTSDLFEVLGAMEECLRGRLIGAVGGPLGPNVDVCLAARRTVVRRSLPRIYLVVARARISDLA
jgi:hypothetical protein